VAGCGAGEAGAMRVKWLMRHFIVKGHAAKTQGV
jgi:hypothetical protein